MSAATGFYFDTEFNEDGETIKPISIGVVADNGAEFYAVFQFDEDACNDWVKEHVIPLLGSQPRRSAEDVRDALLDFVRANTADNTRPQFWAYYADYDWVLLCQLSGRMIDLPEGWPMFCMDLKQLLVSAGNPRMPKNAQAHNALADALWVKSCVLRVQGNL